MLTLNMKLNDKILIGRNTTIIYLESFKGRNLQKFFKVLEVTGERTKIHKVKYYQRFKIAGATIHVLKPPKVQHDRRKPRTRQIKLGFEAPESIRILREKLVAKNENKAA